MRFKCRVMLYKIHPDGSEHPVESGYLSCGGKSGSLTKGESVWVGSISSREGWRTTPVQKFWTEGEALYFKTLNSLYKVICLGKR